MIPRKLAKRLLAEHVQEIIKRADPHLLPASLEQAADAVCADSDLVLRGKENVEQKARRYLTEGRVVVTKVVPEGIVVAEARGSAGERYALGYDPGRKEWRCTCPQPGRRKACSHLTALRLIVEPRPT